MWVMAMFDLPTKTKSAKREYSTFRGQLLKSGYQQLQKSVYARPCPSEESANNQVTRIERNLPADGDVRVLLVTDRQFARMRVFWGCEKRAVEEPPGQLELF